MIYRYRYYNDHHDQPKNAMINIMSENCYQRIHSASMDDALIISGNPGIPGKLS